MLWCSSARKLKKKYCCKNNLWGGDIFLGSDIYVLFYDRGGGGQRPPTWDTSFLANSGFHCWCSAPKIEKNSLRGGISWPPRGVESNPPIPLHPWAANFSTNLYLFERKYVRVHNFCDFLHDRKKIPNTTIPNKYVGHKLKCPFSLFIPLVSHLYFLGPLHSVDRLSCGLPQKIIATKINGYRCSGLK